MPPHARRPRPPRAARTRAPLARRVALALTAAAALAGAGAAAGAQTPAGATCPRAAAATPAGPPPLHLFAYDRAAPLDLRDSVARVDGPVTVRRVSFASPRGGRVTGLLHVPADSLRGPGGRFAGLVLLHGAPGDAAGMEGVAGPLARAGAVVLTIDAPFARRDPQAPITLTAQDSAETVQYVVDLQRAVDVLLARPDVDPARLGALGISYGGASGALLAGVERRVAAYALAVADGGMAEHFSDPSGAPKAPPDGVSAAAWCRWIGAMRPLSALHFVGQATTGRPAPVHLLFQWGRRDDLVPPYLAERLWRAAPEPKSARWYDSGHRLPGAAGVESHQFFARHLGIRPPAPAGGAAPR